MRVRNFHLFIHIFLIHAKSFAKSKYFSLTMDSTSQSKDLNSILILRPSDGRKVKMLMRGSLLAASVAKIRRYLHGLDPVAPIESHILHYDGRLLSDEMRGRDFNLRPDTMMYLSYSNASNLQETTSRQLKSLESTRSGTMEVSEIPMNENFMVYTDDKQRRIESTHSVTADQNTYDVEPHTNQQTRTASPNKMRGAPVIPAARSQPQTTPSNIDFSARDPPHVRPMSPRGRPSTPVSRRSLPPNRTQTPSNRPSSPAKTPTSRPSSPSSSSAPLRPFPAQRPSQKRERKYFTFNWS